MKLAESDVEGAAKIQASFRRQGQERRPERNQRVIEKPMRTEQKDLQESNGSNPPHIQIISPYFLFYCVSVVCRIAGLRGSQRREWTRERIILNVIDATQLAWRLHLGAFLPVEVHLLQFRLGSVSGRRPRAVCRTAHTGFDECEGRKRHKWAPICPGRWIQFTWVEARPRCSRPELIRRLFAALREEFAVEAGAEITVECAPGQLADGTLEAMAEAGVNRVSLGVQSFIDREAHETGRLHSRAVVLDDLRRLRAAGIANLNVDLIAGLPGQTFASWDESLSVLIDCGDSPRQRVHAGSG